MSKRDDIILLQDIVESIENINDYTQDMDINVFLDDRKTKDAVARNALVWTMIQKELPPVYAQVKDLLKTLT
jgi:uncharacterized protein with HEPN domain